MEDSEKTSDSLLEAMAETETSSQEPTAIADEGTDADDSVGIVQDGELEGAEMENEDVEMADGVAEDSENNNLAPEDSMDAPGTILDDEDGSGEVSQGTLSTSEGFLGDQFMSQTVSLIVQNEPPQQLMEEADIPGEGDTDAGVEDEVATEAGGGIEEGSILAEADTSDETGAPEIKDEAGEVMAEGEEETMLDEQEGHEVEQEQSGNVDLGTLSDSMDLTPNEIKEEEEGADVHDSTEQDAGETADDQGDQSEDAIQLRLDESEDLAENEEANEATSVAILAGGDQLEGALSELEGKIASSTGNAVHLLAGQENLHGMLLMEGDDKPEGEGESESPLQSNAAQQEMQGQLNEALVKQEEMKIEDESESQPTVGADALATLASAALDHQAPTNGVKSEVEEPQIKTESDSQEPQWMDVGICKGTHCQVRSFYIPRAGQSWDQNWEGITTSTLPDHRGLAKLELESGKAYKFRVAAINSCGRGPWSEVAAFKTSLPGFPGAPSAIKIAKTPDGAHLSWEPPPIASGVIEDYHVYLAVRTATTDSSRVVSSGATQLAFVRIYQGAANQCSVGNDTLSKAHIDTTTKPAILFRISARNEKGIGPATQVRWLQEVGAPNNAARPAYAPRRPATENKPHGNYKRKKSE